MLNYSVAELRIDCGINLYIQKEQLTLLGAQQIFRVEQSQWIFHGEQSQQLAWKAVHIGLPMLVTAYILGTIVTRMCAVMHAIKLQPGRLYLGLPIMSQGLTRIAGRAECRGKAFQAISSLLSLPRAALRLPPVTYIGRADVYCLPGKAQLSPRFIE